MSAKCFGHNCGHSEYQIKKFSNSIMAVARGSTGFTSGKRKSRGPLGHQTELEF
jgi:hypothetical protein